MDFLIFTSSWMGFNIVLAIIPVITGILFLHIRSRWEKIVLAAIWLVFLPNTIYLLTDPFHLLDDWKKTQPVISFLTIPLYLVLILLGIFSFIFSLYPLDTVVKRKKNHVVRMFVICFINLLVGIGITLGRVERINSWELVTNIPKTLHAVVTIFTSLDLLMITILFMLTADILYFSLENTKQLKQIYRKLSKHS